MSKGILVLDIRFLVGTIHSGNEEEKKGITFLAANLCGRHEKMAPSVFIVTRLCPCLEG
jgi:hypothetical protein